MNHPARDQRQARLNCKIIDGCWDGLAMRMKHQTQTSPGDDEKSKDTKENKKKPWRIISYKSPRRVSTVMCSIFAEIGSVLTGPIFMVWVNNWSNNLYIWNFSDPV